MLFVIFLPFGYSTAVMYIGLLISLLGWIARLIYQRFRGFSGCRYLDIPIVILLGLGIISTALSPEFTVSLRRFWKILQGIILFYLVVNNLHQRKNIIQLVVAMLVVAGLISIYGIICYLTKSRLTYDNRLLGTFKYPNYLAAYLTVMMPLCMGFFITVLKQKQSWKYLMLLGIGSCAMGGSLIFTLTRGAWIAVAIAIIYLIILFDKRLIFVLLVLLAFSPFVMPKHIKSRFMTIIEHQQGFMGERPYWWRAALGMIKEHPLKGIGPGRFKTEYMLRKPEGLVENPNQCHNTYLQIALEMGIPALLAFLLIVSLIFWMIFKSRKIVHGVWDTGFIIGISASMIAYLIHGLTDNVLQRRALLMFWFIAGLLCAFLREKNRRSSFQTRQ
ncbi:O-antigen ligase family protein [bacterium]|nr:O-antigen ligase family protein [bacterium]